MILKRYQGEGMKRRLDALGQALDAVICAGVEIAPFLKTRANSTYFEHRGSLWTLQPWLRGRHVSLQGGKERLAAAEALADLHRVSITKQVERPSLLRVPSLSEKYRHRLERARAASLRATSLRDLWRPFEERALQAVSDLAEPSLKALERDRRRGVLCHRDPAPHNFIWQGGSAAIIDFDLAGTDVRVHDLYQMINHALYVNGYEPGLIEEIVERYDRRMPLCQDNRRVLDVLMNYPSLVVREWYEFGKSGDKKALFTRLRWAAAQEERRLAKLR